MKKELLMVVVIFLISVLVLSGCVAQPYGVAKNKSQKETDLVKQLQDLEKGLNNSAPSAVVENKTSENETNEWTEKIDDAVNETAKSAEEVKETEPVPSIDTTNLQHIQVEETQLVNLKVDAEDADKDKINYTFSAPVDSQGKWQTNYGDAGEYVVTITANDGTNNVEQKVLLLVKKKNVPPTIEDVPQKLEVDEGDLVRITPKISDPNKDAVTLTYSSPLSKDGTWQTDHKSAGDYSVLVTASDGEAETKAKVLLTVRNVNVPPALSGLDDELTVKEGDKITLKPIVSDEDGDKVEVSISDPLGDDGVWQTTYTDHGTYVVTVSASDGKDTVTKEVKITVDDVNVPPRIVAIRQG